MRCSDDAARGTSTTLGVCDELLCAGIHAVEIFWHFAPEYQVVCENGCVVAEHDGIHVELEPPSGLSVVLVRGWTPEGAGERPLGWVSSGFDLKVPATTAVFMGRISGDVQLGLHLRILQ